MDNIYAPVLVFCYKRLDTLVKTVESLLAAKLADKSDFFVFSDGSKGSYELEDINNVRDYIKSITGFKSIRYFFSDNNLGLARSIVNGVSKILDTYETVIVLEDDLIVTPNFLLFMNNALTTYASNEKVFSISGYSFNLTESNFAVEDAYFLTRGWSWGWATWKSRWQHIDWQVSDYGGFIKSKRLKKKFSSGGSDLTSMLRKQMTGKLDSWAIRWFYAQFKVGGLTLYPLYSQVVNIGFDERATNTTGDVRRYQPQLDTRDSVTFNLPETVETNMYFQKLFLKKMGIKSRIRSKTNTLLLIFLNRLIKRR